MSWTHRSLSSSPYRVAVVNADTAGDAPDQRDDTRRSTDRDTIIVRTALRPVCEVKAWNTSPRHVRGRDLEGARSYASFEVRGNREHGRESMGHCRATLSRWRH